MKPLTVKELLELCNEEVANGNGDKHIMISSSDDEGSSFHGLYYAFTTDADTIASYIDSVENVVLLG